MRKKILYISTSVFPYGQAYSTRLINFARLFDDIKYDFHIITDFTDDQFVNNSKVNVFENSTYQIVAGKPSSYNRIKATILSRKVIKNYIDNNQVDFVIVGNAYDRFEFIKKICKEKKIPIILEVVEWYDTKDWRFHNINPYAILYNQTIKNGYTKTDGYITISRYLSNYFSSYSTNVIRIPTILDPDEIAYSDKTNNNKINLVHLGFSGKNKEEFKNILLALDLLGEENERFKYHIYGSDRESVLINIDNEIELLNRLENCVSIHGRIPQEEVNNVYKKSDYSIFIRPEKKSSHAGFPTKLAESMVAGTPVITNDTGDIALYLKNKKQGFVLANDSPEAISETLMYIAEISNEETKKMRMAARKTAEESFDYKNYAKEIERFMNTSKSK